MNFFDNWIINIFWLIQKNQWTPLIFKSNGKLLEQQKDVIIACLTFAQSSDIDKWIQDKELYH